MKIMIRGGVIEGEIQPDIMKEVDRRLGMLAQLTEQRIGEVTGEVQQLGSETAEALSDIGDSISVSEDIIFQEIDKILDEISRLKVLAKKNDVSKVKTAMTAQLRKALVGVALKSEVDKLGSRINRISKGSVSSLKREDIYQRVSSDDDRNTNMRKYVNEIKNAGLPKGTKHSNKGSKGSKKVDGTKYMGRLNVKPKMPI